MKRDLIVMVDGPDGPLPDPSLVVSEAGVSLDQCEVLLGWIVRTPDWLAGCRVPVTTLLTGIGTRAAVAAGGVRSVATRLSAFPGLLAGRLRPAVAVVGGCEDGTGGWRLVGNPGWVDVAVRHASVGVVIERWPDRDASLPGAPAIEGRVLGVIDRTDPPDGQPVNRVGPDHRRIGDLVAGLISEGATIQWGPGVVGASVIAAIRVPVRVRSGLVTDELVDLAGRDLLLGPARAAYLWGGSALRAMVGAGTLEMCGVDVTHDVTALSATERFVAINTALQVGLDGSVNVEVVGGRVVAGPGGHPDFAMAASRSPGGLSIVALPASGGGHSAIVPKVAVVSTPRTDVDVVVTEHGVADLRHCDDGERARRLVAIAAPEFRDGLADATP